MWAADSAPYAALLARLERELHTLPDKPEETAHSALHALWHLAAGQAITHAAAFGGNDRDIGPDAQQVDRHDGARSRQQRKRVEAEPESVEPDQPLVADRRSDRAGIGGPFDPQGQRLTRGALVGRHRVHDRSPGLWHPARARQRDGPA